MKNSTLDIIIVTYNCAACIGGCLDSLSAYSEGINFRLWIVDNNSTDETLAVVRKKTGGWSYASVIEAGGNLGFARGNNLAIKQGHAPNVLLLNPDTLLKPETLAHMLFLLERNQADIAGPALLNRDGSLQRWGGGFFPSVGRAFRHYFFLSNLFKSGSWARGIYISARDERPMEVDWISGAFLMFKRPILEKTGLLREEFFMYAEDMEFCYRAKKQGFRVLYDPTVTMTHLYGQCSANAVSKVDFQSLANASIFFKEVHGRLQGWVFDLITFLGFALRAGIYALLCVLGKSRFSDKMRRCHKLSHVAWQILTGAMPYEF